MINKSALKRKISKSGLKISFIAQELGISRAGLYKKMNNQSEFKLSEVEKISNVLNLQSNDKDTIFFSCLVDKKDYIKN